MCVAGHHHNRSARVLHRSMLSDHEDHAERAAHDKWHAGEWVRVTWWSHDGHMNCLCANMGECVRENMGEKEKERRKGGGKNGRWSEEEKEEGRKGRKGGCEGMGGMWEWGKEGGMERGEWANKKNLLERKCGRKWCLATRLITLGSGLMLLPWQLLSGVGCPYDNQETHGGEPGLCCGEKCRNLTRYNRHRAGRSSYLILVTVWSVVTVWIG